VNALLSDVRDGFQKAVKTANERLKEGKVPNSMYSISELATLE
jgi:hypothetical protein